jgi:hypothetical protein
MTSQEAKAIKTGSAFRMDCAISATIHASPDMIWALLTDGSLPDFGPVFETYVKDLKRAAEGSAS